MKTWIRLAFKEIVNNRRFSLLFIINLSIGLMGFIALNSFNNSLHNHFEKNLNKILTADFIISSSRTLSPEEDSILYKLLGKYKMESRQISFLSMVASSKYSRLSQIIAIDVNYPLYGKILLQHRLKSSPNVIKSCLMTKHGAWMSPNTAVMLGIKVGDSIKIGQKDFNVVDFVLEDPESAMTSFEMAPRIYIGLDQLKGTGLIQFGSRINYLRYYLYPQGTDIKDITDRIKKELSKHTDMFSSIDLIDNDRVSRRIGRAIDHFTGYMGLIGLIALFLSGIGTSYLYRSYLNRNTHQIAILMSLGARRAEAYLMFFIQVILLGTVSSMFASLLSILILPIFPKILQGFLPQDLLVTADLNSLLLALLLGAIGSIIFCLPVILRIHQLKPLNLIKGDKPATKKSRKILFCQIAAFIPAIMVFWFLTVIQVSSLKRGTIFMGGFICTGLILSLAGMLLIVISKKLSLFRIIILKISLRNLYRNRISSVSCFITIALGAYLLNIGPQLKTGIEETISRPSGLTIPSFFLIDIQPEQVDSLKDFLGDRNYQLTNISPFITGEITRINKEDINQWLNRIRGNKKRGPIIRNREFNFSYRQRLDLSEKIIKGRPLTSEKYDFDSGKPVEISLARSFADRFHLNLDDVLEFNIQGIPILGKVVNIREVRWYSFQPNFFILFQSGVLEGAPKIFLASIPQIENDRKLPLQNALVAKFPNISMIDISRMVENIITISDRISFSMKFMAYISILAGLVVIFSIARQETQGRLWEINLLKVLGAGFKDIRFIVMLEFGILGLMASLSSVLLSIFSSYAISYFYFDKLWSLKMVYSLITIIAVSTICAVTALAATGKIIKEKPLSILQAV